MTHSTVRIRPYRRRLPLGVALTASLLVAGCTVTPNPLSVEDNLARVRQDISVVLAPQEPVTKPISMHEAMARAIKYNLDERAKVMESAIASQQLDLSHYDMLPRVVAGAGYVGRNNDSGSESLNLATGRRTGESSTAIDRSRNTADLGFTWNVLDFGVSYLRARQNANLVLISDERRRRVVQSIMQDVRTAYWRAVAAERLLVRIQPLEKRVETARQDAGRLEEQRVQAPLQSLNYRRTLVDTLRQLQSLRRELVAAKSQLGALMGLPPGEPFDVELPPANAMDALPELDIPIEALETYALLNRPELLEETYNARISADETRRALLKLLPGIDLNAALRYDSNSFLTNQKWADYGARISWNMINIISAPKTKAYAEAQEDLVALRRQAISMAVLTQVRVSMLQLRELHQEFGLTAEQADLDGRIRTQYTNIGAAGQTGELGVIQAEVTTVLSDLRRDLVFADLQNAYARVMVSAGVDPLPETVPATDLATLTRAVEQGLDGWQNRANGALRLKDLLQKEPASRPAASEAPKAAAGIADAAPAEPKWLTDARGAIADFFKRATATPAADTIKPAKIEPTSIETTGAEPVAATADEVIMPVVETTTALEAPTIIVRPSMNAAARLITLPATTNTATPTFQVDLGPYGDNDRALSAWNKIAKRLGTTATGKEASLIAIKRSGERAGVQLRIDRFDDRAAAERFCRAAKDEWRDCTIRDVTAMETSPESRSMARLTSP